MPSALFSVSMAKCVENVRLFHETRLKLCQALPNWLSAALIKVAKQPSACSNNAERTLHSGEFVARRHNLAHRHLIWAVSFNVGLICEDCNFFLHSWLQSRRPGQILISWVPEGV
jgi:hypothetical protein